MNEYSDLGALLVLSIYLSNSGTGLIQVRSTQREHGSDKPMGSTDCRAKPKGSICLLYK